MTAATFALVGHVREQLGTAPSRRLRRLEKSRVPAILYGGKESPLTLSLDHNSLWRALENPAFYSHILNITVGEVTYQVVLKALQRHPFKSQILHLDFLRVTATDKITLSVPIRFIGESVAPGVKQGGGIVSHLLTNIEVSCLATQLPEFLEVDLSHLGVNETINLSQLVVPAGVELVALVQGDDRIVAAIHAPRVQSDSDLTERNSSEVPAAAQKSSATDTKNK